MKNLLLNLIICGVTIGTTFTAQLKMLLTDDFDRAELGKGWHINTGSWKIVDGVLRVKEIKADKHSAAARRAIVTQDAVYELRFRFVDEGKGFHFGFDPAKGELKKKGHLFSVIVTPAGWRLMKHIDKARPKEDPNKVLATASATFKKGEWYSLRVKSLGDDVTASIKGVGELKGSHPTFHVKKPTLVFRCIGDGVEIDDIKVQQLSK